VTMNTPFHKLVAASRNRRGFTLLEVTVAGVLLGTVMAVSVPTLGWIVQQRRASLQRQEAIAEVANIMERITLGPWEQITTENVETIKLAGETGRQLPGAKLRIGVEKEPATPDAKRIAIELAWKNRAGRNDAPVRLTAWVYRKGRAE
jgi:hypothetical protein